MDTRYTPNAIEDKWYGAWEKAGAFRPKGEGKPYTIVIPPPNVTGALHMGHALNNTIQDVLIRWRRLQGYRTLWQPGTDHAGIATQSVVERELAQQGIRRQDLGREAFVRKVWEHKEKYGGRIVDQLKKLGCSCDWQRLRFTMDEGLSRAVREVFVRLYEDGLIYQGTRLVNWCPKLQTALADEEVENVEVQGHFWSIRYPLEDNPSQGLVVSTTRPETMFGDVAVAVNPGDERYRHLVGKRVRIPIIDRAIPVIADEHADPTKGSGAVKITPAHDFNDYEVGKRHGLQPIICMDLKADLNEQAGPYAGMNRFKARERLVEELRLKGLLVQTEKRAIPLPTCYRSGDIIEPYLLSQWYVYMKPLAEPALECVEKGETRFVPERYVKTYRAWLEPFRDWCISRQLWWGHRIPAWYVVSETGGERRAGTPVVVARTEEEARSRAVEKYGQKAQLVQEEDVLDTWFSSALWPFSTLGWPDSTPELKTFYPTDVLVTARDIIYFWVARMIFQGLRFLGQAPFHTVYIHGTILDAKGQRMSKSKGNGIDPLEMVDKYGADSVRFALMILTTEGQDIKLSPVKFESGRNFANKLWNAVRFVLPYAEDARAPFGEKRLSLADSWILSRLNTVIRQVTEALEALRFSEAAETLYHFTWDDFCSRYLEIRKKTITQGEAADKRHAVAVFTHVLGRLITLLHPFMPFITEEIRQNLGFPGLLAASRWPQADAARVDAGIEREFAQVFSLVEAVRSIRGQYAIAPSQPVGVIANYADASQAEGLRRHQEIIRNLENIEALEIGAGLSKPRYSATQVLAGGEVHVPLEGVLDLEQERARILKELAKAKGFVETQRNKLANEKFTANAPAEVVEQEKEKLRSQLEKAEKLEKTLAALG